MLSQYRLAGRARLQHRHGPHTGSLERARKRLAGYFVPVLWESMADPILTGREELGWPKIFADIPAPVHEAGRWRASASWEGFTFLDIAAGDFVAGAECPAAPMMFHKYVPRTGEWGEAEIDYFTVTAPEGPKPEVKSVQRGRDASRSTARAGKICRHSTQS